MIHASICHMPSSARAISSRCTIRSIITRFMIPGSSRPLPSSRFTTNVGSSAGVPLSSPAVNLRSRCSILTYNAVSKVYDAPYQVKANNGIYLIDDFGRQRCTPAEVLNRWIVPMERRVDYLTFNTGAKMTVPFEAFLVFSTNLKPAQLGDEAFLRRIQYKMLMRSPDAQEFTQI